MAGKAKRERPKLQVDTAKSAEAEAVRYILWDGDGQRSVRGLGLVVQPTGAKSWIYQFKLAGQPTARVKLGDYPKPLSLDAARDLANAHALQVRAGIDPRDAKREEARKRAERRAAEAVEELTVAALAEEWRKYLPKHITRKGRPLAPRSIEWYEQALDCHVLPHLGSLPVARVTAADAQRMHDAVGDAAREAAEDKLRKARAAGKVEADPKAADEKAAAAGRVAANAAAITLSVFYNWMLAKRRDVLPAGFENPGAKVERHLVESRGENAMVRLSRDQEARLLAAIYDRMTTDREGATALLVLLDTGRRKGEVLGMRWERLDLATGQYRLHRSKSKAAGDAFYIPPRSVEAIRQLRREVGVPWVFASKKAAGGRRAGLQSAWEAVKKAAGVESIAPELGALRIHDLRHHRVTAMLAAGISPALVARQCGWTDLAMLSQVYGHVEADDVAAVMAKLVPVEPAAGGKVVAFPS